MENTSEITRFNLLKTLFQAAPLKASELEELIGLAKKHDTKFHAWLLAHKKEL